VSTKMYAIVSQTEALQNPYPYVHVNEDGTVRELHGAERSHLETLFSPYDGARPYIKNNFQDKNGWGSIEGFCHRSQIPSDRSISAAPVENPNPPMSKADFVAMLKKKSAGFEVIENADGTVTMKRVKRD
jgi:hypothetical protein